jgi:hypothetical protein
MSATVIIFNHSMRPVPYTAEGHMVAALESVEADPTDPVCALAIEHGHVAVLTPQEPVEVADSTEAEVVHSDEAAEVASDDAVEVDDASDDTEGEANVVAKPTPRKKSTSQASKES